MKQIAIIGLGSFGFALLKHFDVKNETILQKELSFHQHSFSLTAYDRKPTVTATLRTTRKHPFLFPNETISNHVQFLDELGVTVENSDYIVLSISSYALSQVITTIKPYLKKDVVIINTSKALERETGKRFSEVTKKILGKFPYHYALMSGGTISQDLFAKEPLGTTIACEKKSVLKTLQHVFNSYNLSVYPSNDLKGVEYAGALKNVVSMLAGIVKGMGFSYGSETYIISRAAYEVEELVVKKLGGKRETFSMGSQCWGNDLWMSCTADTRNKAFGILLGKGVALEKAIAIMEEEGKTVEGINTARVLGKLGKLDNYPLLQFMDHLFSKKKEAKEIENILFNHNF